MEKLIIIVTVPVVLETWLKGQANFLSNYYDVEIITAFSPKIKNIELFENCNIKTLDFNRKINLFKDIKVLFQLVAYLNSKKPKIVYTITPKAGLLGMIAAWVARVPCRLHNIVGLPHLEARGKRKAILQLTERVTYSFASQLYCNSHNLKEVIETGLTKKKVNVIGNGSVNGVDSTYFRDNFTQQEKSVMRKRLMINESDYVITFVGRIVKDKGINELIEAFNLLDCTNLKLMLIGDFEDELDPISIKSKKEIMNNPKIIHNSFQEDIRGFLAISKLFILPSYREGLPNVLLEAGCFGVPLLATDINGCNEVIRDGENGALVKPKDVRSLHEAMKKFVSDDNYYSGIRGNVRKSIKSRYDQEDFLKCLRDEFLEVESISK